MEVTGDIIEIGELISGEGANGSWKKQEIVIKTRGEYPKDIALQFWGDKIPKDAKTGSVLTGDIEVESKKYNDKWYSNIKCWKCKIEPF